MQFSKCAVAGLGLLAWLFSQAATAAVTEDDDLYWFASEPRWVQPVAPDYSAVPESEGSSGGSSYLLFDRQIDIEPTGDEFYSHVTARVLNAAGVASLSELNIGVDPGYQVALIHYVRVVRNGQVIDQSDKLRITALPQENGLEAHIYDGSYNLNVLLQDVRAGDIVDYAYTVRSREPLYPGHYSARMSVGWSNPVHEQRLRVRYPQSRMLHYRFTGLPVEAEQWQDASYRELRFTWRDLDAIQSDDDRPSWYAAWPTLELSDFADWGEVTQQMLPLYQLPTRARPQLDALVTSIAASARTPEEKVQQALQFVQDKIRYTSISIGRGSHIPNDPETVLQRRFGDCKDKSQLLALLLQRLGISAAPAVVHSRRGAVLAESLPTPYAFDHVILRAQIGDKAYWLDGTNHKQSSPLPQLEPADFRHALPLRASTQALEAIPRPAADARRREVEMTLDFSAGREAAANVKVLTRYRGEEADRMRAGLAGDGRAQREADYLNYYARYYPGLERRSPLQVTDDTAANVFETLEQYTLPASESPRTAFTAIADEMYRYGSSLKTSVRRAPLAVDFPDDVSQHITVLLPEPLAAKQHSTQIDNPAFQYRSRVELKGSTLQLDYEYRALADAVAPEAVARYARDREQLSDDLDYRVVFHPQAPQAQPLALSPAPLFIGLFSLGFGGWLMRRYWQRSAAPRHHGHAGTRAGIGGWLLLPAAGAALMPLAALGLLVLMATYTDSSLWQTLPARVDDARSWVQPLGLLLIGVGGLLAPLLAAAALAFFTHRRTAPRLWIIASWSLLAYLACLMPALAVMEGESAIAALTDLLRAVPGTAVWTLYLLRSERVKATFGHMADRSAPASQPMPSAAVGA